MSTDLKKLGEQLKNYIDRVQKHEYKHKRLNVALFSASTGGFNGVFGAPRLAGLGDGGVAIGGAGADAEHVYGGGGGDDEYVHGDFELAPGERELGLLDHGALAEDCRLDAERGRMFSDALDRISDDDRRVFLASGAPFAAALCEIQRAPAMDTDMIQRIIARKLAGEVM